MKKTTEFRVVYVTTPNYETSMHIAKILISEKLAACASVIQNISSIFGWNGNIQERNEFLMIIKTTVNNLELLEERIKELHSDEVPEIIAIPISEGSEEYLNWMTNSTNKEN